jgi:hypothetical protein
VADVRLQPRLGKKSILRIALFAFPLFALLLLIIAIHNATPEGRPLVEARDGKRESGELVQPAAQPQEKNATAAQVGQEGPADPEPASAQASPGEPGRVAPQAVIQGWADTSVLGFKAGESEDEAELHARALGLIRMYISSISCKAREGAPGFTDCKLSDVSGAGESMDESLYHGCLQGFRYNFLLSRYSEIFGRIKGAHGTPRMLTGPRITLSEVSEWGGPTDRFSISLSSADVGGGRWVNGTLEHIAIASVLVVFDTPKCAIGNECFVPAQDLIKERQRILPKLKWAEDMLNAPSSFAARTRIYCRNAILTPGFRSVEELEALYAQLMRAAEPSTREEEALRQAKLGAYRAGIRDAYQNISACQEAFIAGSSVLPTDQEVRERSNEARRRIEEIDEELARRK